MTSPFLKIEPVARHLLGDPNHALSTKTELRYGKKGSLTRGGLYDYTLRRTADGLRISRKKITFIDDRLEGPIDIYHM